MPTSYSKPAAKSGTKSGPEPLPDPEPEPEPKPKAKKGGDPRDLADEFERLKAEGNPDPDRIVELKKAIAE